jgi:hypothetical protein
MAETQKPCQVTSLALIVSDEEGRLTEARNLVPQDQQQVRMDIGRRSSCSNEAYPCQLQGPSANLICRALAADSSTKNGHTNSIRFSFYPLCHTTAAGQGHSRPGIRAMCIYPNHLLAQPAKMVRQARDTKIGLLK